MRDESGIEDEDGFTSFPLGIGISLPLLLYVQDKEPFYVRVKDHNASLVFWKAHGEVSSKSPSVGMTFLVGIRQR